MLNYLTVKCLRIFRKIVKIFDLSVQFPAEEFLKFVEMLRNELQIQW